MRRTIVAAVLALAAACRPMGGATPPNGSAAAGGTTSAGVSVAAGEEFRLQPGQTATVAGELTVGFRRVVEDSRCPRGVQCVRAGEAKVELDLRLQDRVEGAVLSTAGEPRSASLGPYHVHLVALDPLPTQSGPPARYTATLRVERR